MEMQIEPSFTVRQNSMRHGCRAISFTYGTWFVVEAIAACGRSYQNSKVLRKACDFLLSKQLADGGWCESYLSFSNKVYTNLQGDRLNLVQTSWAIFSLIKVGQGNVGPIPVERGVRQLINSQLEDGDFPQHVRELLLLFHANILLYSLVNFRINDKTSFSQAEELMIMELLSSCQLLPERGP